MALELEKRFGYSDLMPEGIRAIFVELCEDVVLLHNGWDLFTDLYGSPRNRELMAELAYYSFKIFRRTLVDEVIIGICCLGDPAQSGRNGKNKNLSLARLVESCPDPSNELTAILEKFNTAQTPVKKFRNERVGIEI